MTRKTPSLLASVSLAALMLCSLPAQAQTNDNAANAERMERLERDLMLLQKQVARGGEVDAYTNESAPTPLTGAGNASAEANLSRMEEEMRKLRGKLEESEFQNKQLSEKLERLQKDVDFRFNELNAAKAPTGAPAAAPAPATVPAPAPAAAAQGTAPAVTEVKPEVRTQTVPLSQPPQDLSVPAATPAAKAEGVSAHDTAELGRMVEEVAKESSTPKEATPSAPAGETSAGDGQLKPPGEEGSGPRELYNSAFKLLNQTKYEEAASQFSDFAQKYPKDPLIGNAYYWLGETHYIRRDYVKAADHFRQGFEALPTGPKAADNLLKLAMSLSAMQKTPEACVVLDQILVKFNKTSSAVTQKAQQERTRIACK